MDSKKWYVSRTFWSGALKILAGLIGGTAAFLSGEVELQAYIASAAAAIWGLYDIWLRFNTSLPLSK